MPRKPFETVAMLQTALRSGGYLAGEGLSGSVVLALAKSRSPIGGFVNIRILFSRRKQHAAKTV